MSQKILNQILNDNEKENILKSYIIPINNFIKYKYIEEVYSFLNKNLTDIQQRTFWEYCILPIYLEDSEIKDKRKNLQDFNQDIHKCASKLANLIQKREKLSESSGLSYGSDGHIIDYINRASMHNPTTKYMYEIYVKNDLSRLSSQFDDRYWPSLHQIISAISDSAKDATVEAYYSSDKISLSYKRHEKPIRYYVHTIYNNIIENQKLYNGNENFRLPDDFQLSYKIFAHIINVIIEEESVSDENIKSALQAIRKKNKSQDYINV